MLQLLPSEWVSINKDVRFVIHVGFPKSIESYIQECGRAGRDALPAKWILYYNYGDRKLLDWFIMNNASTTSTERKEENLHNLYKMIDYLEESCMCRRKLQLYFLGEQFKTRDCKKNCDNWEKDYVLREVNVTTEAKVIVDFVREVGQPQITIMQIIPILRGNKSSAKNMTIERLTKKFTGRLKNFSTDEVKRMIIKMLIMRVLREQFIENQHGMNAYLQLGPRSVDFVRDKIPFYITIASKRSKKTNVEKEEEIEDSEDDKQYECDKVCEMYQNDYEAEDDNNGSESSQHDALQNEDISVNQNISSTSIVKNESTDMNWECSNQVDLADEIQDYK